MRYNNITHVKNESLGSEFDEAQILPSADVQSILLCFCLVLYFYFFSPPCLNGYYCADKLYCSLG